VASTSGFQGIYRAAASPKRQQEVLDRLRWGETPNRIATDLGISRGAVAEILEKLRAAGELQAAPSGD
jgi:DNA-binding NarL/FixJ family response regulator